MQLDKSKISNSDSLIVTCQVASTTHTRTHNTLFFWAISCQATFSTKQQYLGLKRAEKRHSSPLSFTKHEQTR